VSHGLTRSGQNPALRKKIAGYYKAGVSLEGLQKRFQISCQTIYAIIDEFGIPRRRTKENNK
jgi:Mor family transcriptional regulator